MNEFANLIGELEVRASPRGGRKLRGRFPYKKRAVLSDGGRNGGRPQKEEFAPRAFGFRVAAPDKEIHLLVGHDFNRPLASKLTNSLRLTDSDEALTFEADIAPEIAATSYGIDVLAQIDSGLAYGISPGFRLPPPRRVKTPEKFTDEGMDPSRGMFNASIRTIFSALLYELSIVTRPAYKESGISAADAPDKQEPQTDDEKVAAGWTWQNGVLVPPPTSLVTVPTFAPVLKRWRL
ncbi:HK97 family phage prohead protease [Bradyrhizobium sediminis]|uniref:HK97 family phage prohead protease n=1 Tax=Bradyrhizobium sediminis TaxID=2840469 RepID=A0A975RL30_9BRAD|nr:HK97 family phage prohead protease [Bradyrhizobium sediminis]QWG11026.1 HK97 family phage prohead protease [Bradyrhizobium sediminis]